MRVKRGRRTQRFVDLCTFSVVISSLAASIGCVANRAYRSGDSTFTASQLPPIELGTPDLSACAYLSNPRPQNQPTAEKYDLAFIEFDDMGELWTIGNLRAPGESPLPDNSQTQEAVDLIKLRQCEFKAKVTVVTFIHGWKNNASSYDETHDKSLKGFKDTLALFARDSSRHYIGVFIAWRGQVVGGNIFTSYWNRRDTADRVAGTSMTEALFRLMYATKGGYALGDPCVPDDNGGNPYSQFIVIGHSFGGRILERSLVQPLMSLIAERAARISDGCDVSGGSKQTPATGSPFRFPANLVVFINPANDSFEGKAAIEGMMRFGLAVDRPQMSKTEEKGTAVSGPLFLSITSQGDWATGRIMPVAQSMTMLGKKFRGHYEKNASQRGQSQKHRQGYYYRHNEGNVKDLWTHEIKANASCTTADCISFSDGDVPYSMSAIPSAWNTTPFWVAQTPSSLIPNHSDIFQRGVINMLLAIIQKYGTKEPRLTIQTAR